MAVSNKDINILIVDDNASFLSYAESILSGLGYAITTCQEPKRAEFLIRQQSFHIVLIDCLMPELDGNQLARRIYDTFKSSISIILMSGVFKNQMLSGINKFPFLTKPFEEKKLKEVIESSVKKLFCVKNSESLSLDIISKEHSPFTLKKRIPMYESISGIEAIHLLFFNLLAEEKLTIRISCSSDSMDFSISNRNIVSYSNQNAENLLSFLGSNNLLSSSESSLFNNLDYGKLVDTLVSSSLVSPHQILKYTLQQMLTDLNKIGQAENVNISFFPLNYSPVLISFERFTNMIESLIEEDFPVISIQKMFNPYKDNKIIINEEKKEEWINLDTPVLQILSTHIDKITKLPFNKFMALYSADQQSSVYRALMKLIIQEYISFSREGLSSMELGHVYEERCKTILNIIDGLEYDGVFSFLGCSDMFNSAQVQKVYSNFIKLNHPDRFMNYPERARSLIDKINQSVNAAYSLFNDKNQLEKFRREKKLKTTQIILQVESMKKQILNAVRICSYDKAQGLVDELKVHTDFDEEVKLEVFLWNAVIEMEKSGLKIDSKKIEFLNQKLSEMHLRGIVEQPLYHYVMGLVAICNKNNSLAQLCLNKALDIDKEFYLAKLKQLSLSKSVNSIFTKKAS